MAISSRAQAETQRAEACAGGGWDSSVASAQLYKEALEYLVANRSNHETDGAGASLAYENLQQQLTRVTDWLRNRAQGRSRILAGRFE